MQPETPRRRPSPRGRSRDRIAAADILDTLRLVHASDA